MPDYRPILKHYYKLNERKCYEAVYSKERLSVIPHQCSNNKKLASWGKIIIQFIKYARGGTFSGRMVELRVPNKTFKKVLEQNRKDGPKSVIAFLVKDFKVSEEANDLEDLDLFNIKLHSALGNPKGEQNWNNDLTWTAEVWTKWAVMFTFGESFDNGLYYSFASKQVVGDYRDDVDLYISPRN